MSWAIVDMKTAKWIAGKRQRSRTVMAGKQLCRALRVGGAQKIGIILIESQKGHRTIIAGE